MSNNIYTVYQITNKIDGMIYVGAHIQRNNEHIEKYMGSGTRLKEAIKNEGIVNFSKKILHVFDNEESMYDMEKSIVDIDFINSINTYNSTIGGIGGGRPKGTIKGNIKDIPTITESQLETIYNSIDYKWDKLRFRNRLTISLSYYLGLNALEISKLTLDDVYNIDNRKLRSHINVYSSIKEKRKLPLVNDKLCKHLYYYINYRLENDNDYYPLTALIRSRKGSKFTPATMSRMIKEIYISSGFNEMGALTGKITLLKDLYYKGVSLSAIKEILGYSDISSMLRYIDKDNGIDINDIIKNR